MKSSKHTRISGVIVTAATSIMLAGQVSASGYYLPEQSTNAVGLAAAYVANAHGADAAFYNPANLVFEKDKKASMELTVNAIHVPEIEFNGTYAGGPATNRSNDVNIVIPNFFYISPAVNDNWRFGLATASTGLKTQWTGQPQELFAEYTSLQTTEINPVFSYKVNDQFSVGGGLRVAYTEAELRSNGGPPYVGVPVSLNLEGDGYSTGYNLAMTIKPSEQMTLSATYRSRLDLKLKGDAYVQFNNAPLYIGDANVKAIQPAVLGLGVAYAMDTTVVELAYNRLFWDQYQNLDLQYAGSLGPLAPLYDDPKEKNWKNTNTYRIGLTHQYDSKLTFLAGIAFDSNPVPDETVAFELLDTDYTVYGLGAKYKLDDSITLGGGLLYADGDKRTVNNTVYSGAPLSGSFDRSLTLFNLSFAYRF